MALTSAFFCRALLWKLGPHEDYSDIVQMYVEAEIGKVPTSSNASLVLSL